MLKMIDKSQYRLLPANRLDEFEGYDRVVAQNHISNCGCIIVSPEYGDPIDDEYMLEEIYSQIDGLKESVIKRGKVVKLTENDLKYIVLESNGSILVYISKSEPSSASVQINPSY